jgi:hypothetical protein
LLISQVRDKDIHERINKIPQSHDFYNSSRIKQESRQLLVIYHKYQDLFEDDDVTAKDHFNKVQLICYKSTYTGVKRFNLPVDPTTGRFE